MPFYLPEAGSVPSLPLVGHALAMSQDPLALLLRLQREHGDVAPLRLVSLRGSLVSHPDLIDQVLRLKAKHYTRATRVYEVMARFLGRGILTSEGEHWRKHRRIVQPAFHKQRLQSFASAMVRIGARHLDALDGVVDARTVMMRLTLEIVSETLLGVRTDHEAEVIARAVEDAQRHTEAAIAGLALPPSVPTPANLRFKRAVAQMDRVAYYLIEAKRREPGDDVLTMLVEAKYEDGQALSEKQIRDELLTLMAAGHETTANALVWTLRLLSEHPDSMRRLRAEVDEVLGGAAPSFEILPKLTYTRWVIDESLRLYPPAWTTGRVVTEAHELGSQRTARYPMARGQFVLLSPWVTHRRPDLWPNPEGFDPERWRDLDKPGALHPFAFFPFGGGPRKCVGEAFAYLEATIILSMIAQRLELDLVPGHPIVPSPQITLGQKHGLRMRVRRRANPLADQTST